MREKNGDTGPSPLYVKMAWMVTGIVLTGLWLGIYLIYRMVFK